MAPRPRRPNLAAAVAALLLASCTTVPLGPPSGSGAKPPSGRVPPSATGPVQPPPGNAAPPPSGRTTTPPPGPTTTPVPGGAAPAPGSAAPPSDGSVLGGLFGGLFGYGLSPALELQRARLKDVLSGTPVVVEVTPDKRLRIDVPTRYAFDPRRWAVKPPAAAVLDQIASGYNPHAGTTELHVNAPGDDDASDRVVEERAMSARDYLVSRGVPLTSIVTLGRSAQGLEIVVSDRAAAAQ